MKKILFFLVIFLSSYMSCFAATIESKTTGGNWTNPSTWSGGVVPNSSTDSVILKGPITLNAHTTVGSDLTVGTGATLSGTYSLTVNGNITNNGTVNALGGYVYAKGDITNNTGSVWKSIVYLSGTQEERTLKFPVTGLGEMYLQRNIKILGDFNYQSFINLSGYTLSVDGTKNIDIWGIVGRGILQSSNGTGDGETIKVTWLLGGGGGSQEVKVENVVSPKGINGVAGMVVVRKIEVQSGGILYGNMMAEKITTKGTVRVTGGGTHTTVTGEVQNDGTMVSPNGYIFTVNGNFVNNGNVGTTTTTDNNYTLTVNGNITNNGTVNALGGYVYAKGDITNNTGSVWKSIVYLSGTQEERTLKFPVTGLGEMYLQRNIKILGDFNYQSFINLSGYTLSVDGTKNIDIWGIVGRGILQSSNGTGDGEIIKVTWLLGGGGGSQEVKVENVVSPKGINGVAGMVVVRKIEVQSGGILYGNMMAEKITTKGTVRVTGGGTHTTVTGEVQNDGTMVSPNGYIFTVNGNFVNNGNIGTTTTTDNNYTLTVNGNIKNNNIVKQISGGVTVLNGHIQNTGTIQANTFIKWSAISGYSNYLLTLTGYPDIIINGTTQYQLPAVLLSQSNKTWTVVGKGILYNSAPTPTKCINVSGCIVNTQTFSPITYANTSTNNSGAPTANTPSGENILLDTVKSWFVKKSETTAQEDITAVSSKGDPVNLFTGEFAYSNPLISYPTKGGKFEFIAHYKNRAYYNGPLGNNWDFNFNKFLREDTSGNLVYHDGNLGAITFVKNTSGTYDKNQTLRATLVKNTNGTYTLTYDSGEIENFSFTRRITSHIDANGNTTSFVYDNDDRLVTITDSNSRNYSLTYTTTGRVKDITDFAGYTVNFTYFPTGATTGNENDLKKILLVNGGYSKEILFEYTLGTDFVTAHNLTKLIDTKGQTYVENTYTNDRVATQKYGSGTLSYSYTVNGSDQVTKNTVTDRVGRVTEYEYDSMGNTTKKTLKSTAGDIVTNYVYNTNGKLTQEIYPRGNGFVYAYDSLGNLVEKRQKTDVTAANSSSDIVTSYVYGTSFPTPTQVTSPSGLVTTFTLDTKGRITRALTGNISNNGITYTQDTAYVYDTLGQLTSTTDSEGITTTYTYQNGQIKTKTRGTAIETYNYDSRGNLTSKVDALGNTVTLTYDDFNRLTQETSPSNIVTMYSYDVNNNITQKRIVVGTGVTKDINTTYDILDHASQIIEDLSATQTATLELAYNNDEKITQKILPNGLKEVTTYDSYGRVSEVQQKQGSTVLSSTSFTYDTNGNILTQTTNGVTTTFTYDLFDRLSSATDALGNSAEYTYDSAGNATLVTTKNSSGTVLAKTETTYNEVGLSLISKKHNLENTTTLDTSYTYNRNGQVLTVTDPLSRTTTNVYDALGRLSTTTLVNGLQTKFTYNVGDQITKKEIIATSPAKTISTTYTYDSEGRVLTETDDLNHTTSYTYNKLSQVVSVTDKKGIVTSYTYDFRGKLLTETRAGKTITYSYDVAGNLTQLIDALGNVTTYTYDILGRQLSQTDASNKTTTYTYDAQGNVATKTDANGTVTTYSYDGLNRLTGKSINRGTNVEGVTSESYTYDALGRLVSSTDSDNHTITFAYNSLSQLVSESNNGQTITYEYDTLGNLTKTTYPSGKQITRTYDTLNRLTEIKNGTQTLDTYSYDQLNLTTETLGNGRVTNYTYDTLNRLASLSHPELVSGSAISETLTYDTNSNITSNGLENYTYDSLNQLTQVTNIQTPTVIQDFAYDLMGNRTQVTTTNQTNTETQDYTKNALNEYTQTQTTSSGTTDTTTYTYDDNGNLTEDSTNKYIYDYKNRLVEVKRKSYDIVTTETTTSTGMTCPETGTGSTGTGSTGTGSTGTGSTGTGSTGTGSTGTGSTSTGCTETTTTNTTTTTTTIPEYTLATYKYDTLGRRYEKKTYNYNETTQTTDLVKDISYTYSNQDAIQETENISNTTKEYIYGNEIDDLVASIQNGTTTYYEKNHLGSIVNVSDASGATLTQYQYDVYGKATITSGSDTGNVRLFTGREYDEETGLYFNRARYYSPTFGRFISRDPIDIQDDVNLYSYTANNPVNFTDRQGTDGKSILGKAWGELANFLGHEAGYIGAGIYNTTDFFGSNDYLTGGYSGVINDVKKCDSQATGFSAGYICGWQREQETQIILDWASGVSSMYGMASMMPTTVKNISKAPGYIVSPKGTAYPVPKGAEGPVPVINKNGIETGKAFVNGNGGTNGQVNTMRIMNPNSRYPNGYIKYENNIPGQKPQGVDPYTGKTGFPENTHFPLP